jgi:hypothetical protein
VRKLNIYLSILAVISSLYVSTAQAKQFVRCAAMSMADSKQRVQKIIYIESWYDGKNLPIMKISNDPIDDWTNAVSVDVNNYKIDLRTNTLRYISVELRVFTYTLNKENGTWRISSLNDEHLAPNTLNCIETATKTYTDRNILPKSVDNGNEREDTGCRGNCTVS